MVEQLPVKIKKLKVKNRFFNYLVVDHNEEATLIRKRESKDIWRNLYEFPLQESIEANLESSEVEKFIENELELEGSFSLQKYNHSPIVHKLTHQTIFTSFWIIRPTSELQNLTPWKDLNKYALPVLLQNFVDKYQSSN